MFAMAAPGFSRDFFKRVNKGAKLESREKDAASCNRFIR